MVCELTLNETLNPRFSLLLREVKYHQPAFL